jgi:dTDP-4-amino-4,6-dideoxygalactose transaminase
VDIIRLVDLAAQHEAVADEVAEGWRQVVDRTAFIGGAQVRVFEQEYASFIGTRHCVGMGNGTDAIEITLRALGVGPGDECILPANTFIATAEAVCRIGAVPILADCADDGTYLLDSSAVEAAISPRTRAIIPVHLYGQAAAVEQLMPIAERAGAWVVEDAAQAHGARRNGNCAGALGHAAATSFYPGKNLGAYGDAGAALTSSGEAAERIRLIANHGSPRKYEHTVLGFNTRMDTLQAVVLLAKLRHLPKWNAARRVAAQRYEMLLSGVDGVILPSVLEGNEHVWHLYVVRVSHRDRVLEKLHAAGIEAGIHYPTPIHHTPALADLIGNPKESFPVTEQIADELLTLPLYPEITPSQQERVVSTLADALR